MSGQGAVRLAEGERAAVRRALHEAWLAVHVRRFDGDYDDREVPEYAKQVVPDNIYNGTIRAERAITETAATYGIDYHALRDLRAVAPVPPADETEPQAGASGDGGGLG